MNLIKMQNKMRKFLVDDINRNNKSAIIVRLLEVEEIGDQNNKSVITKDGSPEFVAVWPDTTILRNFEKLLKTNQVITVDFFRDFNCQITTDSLTKRKVNLYIPLSDETQFSIDYELTDFFNQISNSEDNGLDDDFF